MENNITGIDRISDLPDALLTHILSFLSVSEVAQTCILSKRWRSTWSSMSVLKFDFENFVPADLRRISEYLVKLEKFVERVFQNRDRSLSLDTFKFRLDFVWNFRYYDFYPSAMKCILLALEHKPRLFSVHVCGHIPWDLDFIEPIFTCASLQSISLKVKYLVLAKRTFQLSWAVNLPCLKRLKLGSLRLADNFLKILFSRCPVLEELELLCCFLHAPLLCSKVLNSLVLKCCYFENNLAIYAPSLVHLDIYHTQSNGGKFSLENMESLVDARIECFSVHDDARMECFIMSEQSDQFRVARELIPNWPNFKNLKSVQLGGLHRSNVFDLIAFILLKSPNLRKLGLQVYPPNWCNMKEKSIQEERRDVLPLRDHLEVVEIANNYMVSEEIVDQLIKKLSALVKTIGKIIVIKEK